MFNTGVLDFFGLVCPIGFDTSRFFFFSISGKFTMNFFLAETIVLHNEDHPLQQNPSFI